MRHRPWFGREHAGRALLLALAGWCWAAGAQAMTLAEAQAGAYASNPQLAAARVSLRKADELMPQALAGRRPTVEANAGVAATDRRAGPVASATAKMPLWTAGRVDAAVGQASEQIEAGRAQLTAVEQDVLLRATTAYVDVIRAQGVLDATRQHERALAAELASARRRQAAGVLTATDVAGTRSQLAAATAKRAQAESDLEIAREVFRTIVGAEPANLTPPPPAQGLPAARDEVIAAAADAPAVQAANRAVAAAKDGVGAALAQLRPSLGAEATAGYPNYSLGAVLTIPLYDGGLLQARARSAREDLSQRRLELDGQRRNARQNAIAAWQALATARANLDAYTTQADAARATRDGVRRELDQGLRTQLQVLQAEQQVIDAELNLLGARRDSIVAGYQVLAAMGRLTARDLGLPVELYDPTAHAAAVAHRAWDQDVEKEAYGFGAADAPRHP